MGYTIVGQIINTHGIRGTVKVFPLTSDINRFKLLTQVYLGDKKLELIVSSVSIKEKVVLVNFQEYDNINAVSGFVNSYLYVSDEDRVKLPENHYFIYDLIGCSVVNEEDMEFGRIIDVLQGFSNDVYVVDGKNGSFMIPAVKEFIKKVSISDRKITVRLIEGMIE